MQANASGHTNRKKDRFPLPSFTPRVIKLFLVEAQGEEISLPRNEFLRTAVRRCLLISNAMCTGRIKCSLKVRQSCIFSFVGVNNR